MNDAHIKIITEIVENLLLIQNKLKNKIIKKAINESINDDEFHYDDLIFAIDKYIEYRESLLSGDINYLKQLANSLKIFLNRTESEYQVKTYTVELLDSINVIIDYQINLLHPDLNNNKSTQITEEEFSNRYDNLMNLLNTSDKDSNLTLYTKSENKPFKLFRNSNNSLSASIGSEENNISLTKERLTNTVYRNQEYNHHKSYADVVIEKILDNTIFGEIKNETVYSHHPELGMRNMEKERLILSGKVSNLEDKIAQYENDFNKLQTLLIEASTLEENFNNAKEAVLKNIELKQATSYWQTQATRYSDNYIKYFQINLVVAILLILTTYLFINYSGLFTENVIQNIDSNTSKITDSLKSLVHSVPFFNYVIFILFTTLVIWFMKILVKIMLSNYHLAVDANERVIMLNTYLVLLEDGKGFKDEDRKVILDNVFRQTNHGIIKDETSVTVADIVSSFKK